MNRAELRTAPRPTVRLRRCAVAVSLAAVAAGGLAACGSSAATTTSATSTAPAAGVHLISTNGHKLAFYVTPGHLPAIVLDAGGGLDASAWSKVAPVLAKQTGSEVISYDRAGEGRSEEVAGPWKAQDAVSDLHAGLTSLGVGDHIVLVAHSLAGEIATNYVRQYPGTVDGAVLVDASLPQFYTADEVTRLVTGGAPLVAAAKKAPSTRATRQLIAEATDYGPVHTAYHRLTWPASVPVTAIVSATTPYDGPLDANRWRAAQAAFVKAAPNRTLVTATKSSHDIEIDRPDTIVSATEAMVSQVH